MIPVCTQRHPFTRKPKTFRWKHLQLSKNIQKLYAFSMLLVLQGGSFSAQCVSKNAFGAPRSVPKPLPATTMLAPRGAGGGCLKLASVSWASTDAQKAVTYGPCTKIAQKSACIVHIHNNKYKNTYNNS